ncbi:MAG: hypothetical protein M3421_09710 [Bacteroidota bacterium]|nr:hypothetical protein [Bacteroidota bacterium]
MEEIVDFVVNYLLLLADQCNKLKIIFSNNLSLSNQTTVADSLESRVPAERIRLPTTVPPSLGAKRLFGYH